MGVVYTKIISTNVNKDKSILMYRHSFIMQRCSAICFDLQDVINRRTYKNSVLVLELYFNMDSYYYNCFIFDIEYCLVVKHIKQTHTRNALIIFFILLDIKTDNFSYNLDFNIK
jgi:hypothetical protein